MTSQDFLFLAPLGLSVLLFGYGALHLTLSTIVGERRRLRRRLVSQPKDPNELKQMRASVIARNAAADGRSLWAAFTRRLSRANVKTQPSTVLALTALGASVITAICAVLVPFIPTPLAFVIGPVIAFGVLFAVLGQRCRARIKAVEAQFPDALDLIVRALRIGLPLSSTLEVVAREMPDPISTEFRKVFEEINYGQSLNEALTHFCERVPMDDLRYFTVAVQIQNESGGNLSEILSNLANIIRERFRLYKKVQSLTTEGRMSAWFLTGFPFAIVGFIQLIKPDYYTQLMGESYFYPAAMLVAGLLLLNFIAMKVITTIKV